MVETRRSRCSEENAGLSVGRLSSLHLTPEPRHADSDTFIVLHRIPANHPLGSIWGKQGHSEFRRIDNVRETITRCLAGWFLRLSTCRWYIVVRPPALYYAAPFRGSRCRASATALGLRVATRRSASAAEDWGRVENRIQHPVGQAYLLPPLSSGGALIALP